MREYIFIDHNEQADKRSEDREMGNYPRPYIKIKSLDEHSYSGGLIIDSSSSGLGILTTKPLPIGSKVAISLDDEYAAIAEVVNIIDDYDEWDWSGMSRMSVRLIDKTNWLQ